MLILGYFEDVVATFDFLLNFSLGGSHLLRKVAVFPVLHLDQTVLRYGFCPDVALLA